MDKIIWLSIALLAYNAALKLYQRTHHNALVHPIVVSALLILGGIYLLDASLPEVVADIHLLHWLLGPTTVALAIPIYRQTQLVKQLGMGLLLPILVGGLVAPLTAWLILYCFDSSIALQLTILTKSITTPLAMDTARLIGGIPTVAAIVVIMTGIVGVVFSPWIFGIARIKEDAVKGLTLGIFAHGIGTAKALQISERAGAFASLALGINGVVTAIILSLVLQ